MNLGGLVSSCAAAVYRRMVLDGPVSLDGPDASCLAELDEVGLATRSPCHPGMAVAVPPEVAFGQLLTRFTAGVAARQAALCAAMSDAVCWDDPAEAPVELLTDPLAVQRVAEEVMTHARTEACEFAVATHDPSLVELDPSVGPLTGPGVRSRVVYAAACLSSALGRQIIDVCREAGEEQRFFSGWMTGLRIGDDSVAVVRLDGGALYVRSRPLVALLRTWFDLVWERSAPPSDSAVRLSAQELAVLEMQAAGHKDAAIARALGCNVRTVRRHVAAILAALGVDSRFAAGVEAVRRGWLGGATREPFDA